MTPVLPGTGTRPSRARRWLPVISEWHGWSDLHPGRVKRREAARARAEVLARPANTLEQDVAAARPPITAYGRILADETLAIGLQPITASAAGLPDRAAGSTGCGPSATSPCCNVRPVRECSSLAGGGPVRASTTCGSRTATGHGSGLRARALPNATVVASTIIRTARPFPG